MFLFAATKIANLVLGAIPCVRTQIDFCSQNKAPLAFAAGAFFVLPHPGLTNAQKDYALYNAGFINSR